MAQAASNPALPPPAAPPQIDLHHDSQERNRLKHRDTPGEITVASMNLHCGIGGKGKPFDVEAAIRGLDAQVIALQETWSVDSSRDPVTAVAEALGAQLSRVPLLPATSLARLGIAANTETGSYGMAVLSAFPVTGYEIAYLGRVPGDIVPRCAQILTLRLPAGSGLRLVATHLTHRFVSPAQLWRLLRRLDGTPLPTVIAGDLNMPRQLARLAASYAPAVQGRTWPAELPVLQLDHVLASSDIERVEGTVLGPAGSDHRAVWARLRVRAPA
jgi:endonuclease/exonuclease/phosphatase family metal-dependent hydrolase